MNSTLTPLGKAPSLLHMQTLELRRDTDHFSSMAVVMVPFNTVRVNPQEGGFQLRSRPIPSSPGSTVCGIVNRMAKLCFSSTKEKSNSLYCLEVS